MRCGKCSACLVVESAKASHMPSPYSVPPIHATDEMVADWNRIVRENPCEKELEELTHGITATVNILFKKGVHSSHAFRDWFYDADYLVRSEVLEDVKAGLKAGKTPAVLADELHKAHGGF